MLQCRNCRQEIPSGIYCGNCNKRFSERDIEEQDGIRDCEEFWGGMF